MASLHEGHRQRMRNKYFKNGLDAFEPHEILEMLLFFTRLQGNTNPLAHKLIDHFGSLDKVLQASPAELMIVDGVGEHSAMLLSMIVPIYRQCMLEQNPKPKVYKGVEECGKYLQAYFNDKTREEFVLMMFDNGLHLIGIEVISTGVANRAQIDFKKLLHAVVTYDATNVVISHNHPKGNSLPSKQDAHATITVRNLLKGFSVELLDHIVVGQDDYVSMISSDDYCDIFDDSKQKQALAAFSDFN